MRFLVLLAFAGLASACAAGPERPSPTSTSTSGAGTGGGGGAGGIMGAGGQGGSGGMSFDNPVTLKVIDPVAQAPISGLEVCLRELPSSCSTTDEMGAATLEAPLTGDLTFEYRGPEVRPHLVVVRGNSGSTTITTTALSDANLALAHQLLGETEDPNLAIIVSGANVEGAEASMTPASGFGPYYAGPTGLPDPNRTSTSTTGPFFWGNVATGSYEVSVVAPGLQCETRIGIVGSQPNATLVLAEAGTVTVVSPYLCQ